MKKLLTLFLIINSLSLFASSVRVELEPKEPVMNEPFRMIFTIISEKGENPQIQFEPSKNLEVISQGNPSVSTRTSYINGKMTYERKIRVPYDFVASRDGMSFLRQINIVLGDHRIKHKTVSIRVLRNAKKLDTIFVKAEVEKSEYYVGESISVRYYLYNKSSIPVNSVNVKKFPKLDKFLKRYHQEKDIPERVQIKGEVYNRRVVYTAQLFGEKPGKYIIDPISLGVQYSRRRTDPFGGFGIGLRMGALRSRTVRSQRTELEIINLPALGMPKSFTGLVGKHSFRLKTNKTKYLSNEPIELELEVVGDGALELFEAPKIFTNDLIEEFETTADFKVNPDFSAVKKFDYTYLGRGNVDIKSFELPLSYFDTSENKYKTIRLSVNELKVVALAGNNKRVEIDKVKEMSDNKNTVQRFEKNQNLVFEPLYKMMNSFVFYSKHLVWLLSICILFLLIFLLFKLLARMRLKERSLFDEVYLRGITYQRLYNILKKIGVNESMEEIIEKANIDDTAKTYFKDIIREVNAEYRGTIDKVDVKVKKKHFKTLEKYLQRI